MNHFLRVVAGIATWDIVHYLLMRYAGFKCPICGRFWKEPK